MATMSANEALLRRFFERWAISYDELCAAISDTMHENCVFQQTRIPDLHGPAATVAFLHQGRAVFGYATFDVEVKTVICEGKFVAAERIDYMKDDHGTLLATFPAVSIMQIENGKITAWRDYFDSADMPSPRAEQAGAAS